MNSYTIVECTHCNNIKMVLKSLPLSNIKCSCDNPTLILCDLFKDNVKYTIHVKRQF